MSYPKVSIHRYKSGDFRITRRFANGSKFTIISEEELGKMNELNDAAQEESA